MKTYQIKIKSLIILTLALSISGNIPHANARGTYKDLMKDKKYGAASEYAKTKGQRYYRKMLEVEGEAFDAAKMLDKALATQSEGMFGTGNLEIPGARLLFELKEDEYKASTAKFKKYDAKVRYAKSMAAQQEESAKPVSSASLADSAN